MRRRDLLQGGVIGAGALALPLDALAGSDAEVSRVLSRIDRRCGRVAERMSPLRDVLNASIPPEEQGIYDSALRAILATVVYGELSSVRRERQAHPAIQARIAEAAGSLARGLGEVVAFVERIGQTRWRELHSALFRDRPRLDGLLDRIGREVADAGLPPGAVRQLENTSRRLAFRMEEHGSDVAIVDLVAQFRRLEQRVNAAHDPFDALRVATPAAMQADAPADAAADAPVAAAPDDAGRQREIALGALLLGVGVVGGILFVAGSAATEGFLVWCVCISIPLITGLVLILTAGVMLLVEG